jgi:hypothetical protein
MVFIPRSTHLRVAFSDDLVTWSESVELCREPDHGVFYVNLVDAEGDGTDRSIGTQAWLYYTRSDYQVWRRLVRFLRDGDGTAAELRSVPVAELEGSWDSVDDFATTHGRWTYAEVAATRLQQGETAHWSPLDFDPASEAWVASDGFQAATRTTQSAVAGRETARIWRSPGAGRAKVDLVAELDESGGPAVGLRLMLNRQIVWPKDDPWHYLTHARPTIAHAETVDVTRGDRLVLVALSPQGEPGRSRVHLKVQAQGSPDC